MVVERESYCLLDDKQWKSMSNVYAVAQTYDGSDFRRSPLPKGDYEECHFTHCQFSESDLSEVNFVTCTMEYCDLSMTRVVRTAFKDVTFRHCKLLGVHFEDSEKFLLQLGFNDCLMNLATFNGLNLKGTRFSHCQMQEADFTGTDLCQAVFHRCDLHRAIFDRTQLAHADFRSAFHYSIDPGANLLKKTQFSLEGVRGLLDAHDIIIE